MMHVSVTELRLKNVFRFFAFSRYVRAIRAQLKTAKGLVRYRLAAKSPLVFHTVTAWESEQAMYEFMRSGAHLEAMKNVRSIASHTRYTRRRSETFPSVKEAREWLEHDMPEPLAK